MRGTELAVIESVFLSAVFVTMKKQCDLLLLNYIIQDEKYRLVYTYKVTCPEESRPLKKVLKDSVKCSNGSFSSTMRQIAEYFNIVTFSNAISNRIIEGLGILMEHLISLFYNFPHALHLQ